MRKRVLLQCSEQKHVHRTCAAHLGSDGELVTTGQHHSLSPYAIEQLSHVRQHAFYSRRYFDDPLRASQITIVPYKNYFPEKKKLTIEESDSEEEEDGGLAPVASTASADLEQASSPLSDVDMAPLDPVSDAESPPLSPLSDLSDVMSP